MAFSLPRLFSRGILISLLYASLVTGSANQEGREADVTFTPTNQIVWRPITDLGPAAGLVGYNTKYQAEHVGSGSSTSIEWTASDTAYLTEEVITTTSSQGSTTTTGTITTSVQVVAATATADAPGINAGDVTVTFSPELVSKLQGIAENVCGKPSKQKRSGAASCGVDFARQAGGAGGPLEFDIPLPTISSADVAAVLSAVGGAVNSESAVLGWAVILLSVYMETGSMPDSVSVPPSDISDVPSSITASPSSSTSSLCPTGSNIPLCQDKSGCGSPNNQTCTTSVKYDMCSCAPYAISIVHEISPQFLITQQQILGTFASFLSQASATPSATPTCSLDWSQVYSPMSWCDCGPSTTYPTLSVPSTLASSDMSSALCAYTSAPSETIQPTSISGSSLPTGVPGEGGCDACAYYIASDHGLPSGSPDYCYCPGCSGVAPASAPLLTHGTPPTTDCQYTTQPSPTWAPGPPPVSTVSFIAPILPPPFLAPAVGPLTCNNYDDSFKGCWNDVHVGDLHNMLDHWSVLNQPIDSTYGNLTQVYKPGKGVTYMGSIGWIPGCTLYQSQWPAYPQRAPSSSATDSSYFIDIIGSTYAGCTSNNGLGGYRDVGCLRYGFYPNNIPGVFGSPPNPGLYWQSNGDIC